MTPTERREILEARVEQQEAVDDKNRELMKDWVRTEATVQ